MSKILYPERIPLANLPTPLERLERLSAQLGVDGQHLPHVPAKHHRLHREVVVEPAIAGMEEDAGAGGR